MNEQNWEKNWEKNWENLADYGTLSSKQNNGKYYPFTISTARYLNQCGQFVETTKIIAMRSVNASHVRVCARLLPNLM